MSNEVDLFVNQQLEVFKNEIAKNPTMSGEYYIPDMRMEEKDSDKNQLLSRLLTFLAMTHHQYIWQQSESLNPNVRGVMIRWIPKR
jgi:hypothetical protein